MKKDNAEKRNEKLKKHIRAITVIAFLAFFVLSTVLSIPLIKALRTEDGMKTMAKHLESYSGPVGVLVFLSIQTIQVIIAVIPAVQIVGGILFGWFFGTILSFAGILLGSYIVFLIVGKFGRPVAEAFVDEKKLKKFSFLEDEKKLTGVLMLLYLLPAFPKDVLTYFVPLTKISKRDFFLYVMPCRIPAVVLSTVLGSNAVSGNFRTVLVLLAVCAVLGIAGFVLKEPMLRVIKKKRHKHSRNEEAETETDP